MNALIFLIIIFLSLVLFFIPRNFKYWFTLILVTGTVLLTSCWSIGLFSGNDEILKFEPPFQFLREGFILTIDRLSGFFIIVINITVFTAFIYAGGYLKSYSGKKKNLLFSIHYFSFLWLYLSMLLVVMVRNGLAFLIVWEIMALSSFFLVIFDAEDRTIIKTGISYLIQMHVGMFFILVAFMLVERATGEMSFDALKTYFLSNSNLPLFLLFFTGFGIKAGFIPLHTWLPEAHPDRKSVV